MAVSSLLLLCLAASVQAQSSSTASSTSGSSASSSASSGASSTTSNAPFSFSQSFSYITTDLPSTAFTGSMYTYISYDGQSSVQLLPTGNGTYNATSSRNSQITRTQQTGGQTQISGTNEGSSSSTSSAAAPVNTIPCNNYPEFCNRQYSNITEVCAHNSAFAIKNNVASNQIYDITIQLNDGIRMLQGETHQFNNSIYNCHTSCDLLNAGTFQSTLETLVAWLERNPYDVVTWLIVNSDFVDVEEYVAPIQNSGIGQYLYTPQYVPQHRDQWPTLGQMILSGKRVVLFMDYNADQNKVPYVLDEFTHMWETPFSPTDVSFPCTQQRPPNLNATKARDQYMYLANHNLNVAVSLQAITGSDTSLLIPNTADINRTNGEFNQIGQMGAMALNCTADWGRPPNFLLVDYYNFGDPKMGSVFEVAAQMNNVTYNGHCCGSTQSAAPIVRSSILALGAAIAFATLMII